MKNIKFLRIGLLNLLIAISTPTIAQDKPTVDKQECYTLLGVNKNASLEQIEYAYHKKVDVQHAIIKSAQVAEIFDFNGKIIKIYGYTYSKYVPLSANEMKYHSFYYKDRYGNKFYSKDFIIIHSNILWLI